MSNGGTGGAGAGQAIQLGQPSTTLTTIASQSYNSVQAQDSARKNIAYALLGMTAGIVVAGFFLAFFAIDRRGPIEDNLNTVLSLLNVVFGPVVALLGSATGFYFGANAAARTDR